MKKKGNYNIYCFVLLLVLAVCLSGCGKNRQPSEERMGNTTEVSAVLESGQGDPGREYVVTFQNYTPESGVIPFEDSMQMTEDALYFSAVGSKRIYRVDLEQEEYSAELLPIEHPGLLCMSVAEQPEQRLVCCAYDEENQAYYLYAYDGNYRLLWERDITKAVPEAEKENLVCLNYLVQDAEGRIYIKGQRHILVFDREGNDMGNISCPWERFENIVVSGEGKVYASSGIIFEKVSWKLAELEPDSLSCMDEREIFGQYLTAGQTEGICFFETRGDNLCEYNFQKEESRKLLSYTEYNILPYEVSAYHMGEKQMRFIIWEEQSESIPIEIMTLTKGENPEGGEDGKQQKQQLTLLTFFDDSSLESSVKAFNRRNDAYEIQVEQLVSWGNTLTEEQMMTKFNSRIVTGDVDLIYIGQKDYQIYKEQKIFENLLPYMENGTVKADDYMEVLLNPLRQDQELYTLPTNFSLKSYGVLLSRMESRSLSNMDDYLDFIEKHPDLKWRWGGSKAGILELCMKYGWERFVNLEEGSCCFDGEEFKALAERIKGLMLDSKFYDEEWEQLIAEGAQVMPELEFSSLSGISAEEEHFGGEMVLIGYPGPDERLRTGVVLDNLLCISSRSGKKEAAFAFWEYYIEDQRQKDFSLSARKEDFEKQMEQACTRQYALEEDGSYSLDENGEKIELPVDYLDNYDHSASIGYYALDQRQQDMMKQAVEGICMDTPEGIQIQKLVLEEMLSYLNGDKSFEAAAEILQNRLQLYINERKSKP